MNNAKGEALGFRTLLSPRVGASLLEPAIMCLWSASTGSAGWFAGASKGVSMQRTVYPSPRFTHRRVGYVPELCGRWLTDVEDRTQPVAQPEPYDGQDAQTIFSSQKPVITSDPKVNYRGPSSPPPQEPTLAQVLESSGTSSVVIAVTEKVGQIEFRAERKKQNKKISASLTRLSPFHFPNKRIMYQSAITCVRQL
jgi:hypothetical protein